MILKIQMDIKDVSNKIIGSNWRWISNIVEVSNQGKILKKDLAFTGVDSICHSRGNKDTTTLLWVKSSVVKGIPEYSNMFRIYFDTIVYICNDDGKTIDKIVG